MYIVFDQYTILNYDVFFLLTAAHFVYLYYSNLSMKMVGQIYNNITSFCTLCNRVICECRQIRKISIKCVCVILIIVKNSETYPYANLYLNFDNNHFALLYEMYEQLQQFYYEKENGTCVKSRCI